MTNRAPGRLLPRPDHHCSGCGALNPCGLHLSFATDDAGGVSARFTPRPQDEGFFDVVHGGIVTAMLDEAMAWAAFTAGIWAVTAKLDIRFRSPVRVGAELLIGGRVLAQRGRLVETAAEVRRADDGLLLAEATALFVRVPEAQAAEWRARYVPAPTG